MNEHATERLARIFQKQRDQRGTVNLEPTSAYEAVTRQMVMNLSDDVRDLKHRIDTLIFVVLAGIIAQVAMRLLGG